MGRFNSTLAGEVDQGMGFWREMGEIRACTSTGRNGNVAGYQISDLRTVCDTGVAVSAILLPQSIPRQAFDLAIESGRLLISEATLEEIGRRVAATKVRLLRFQTA